MDNVSMSRHSVFEQQQYTIYTCTCTLELVELEVLRMRAAASVAAVRLY